MNQKRPSRSRTLFPDCTVKRRQRRRRTDQLIKCYVTAILGAPLSIRLSVVSLVFPLKIDEATHTFQLVRAFLCLLFPVPSHLIISPASFMEPVKTRSNAVKVERILSSRGRMAEMEEFRSQLAVLEISKSLPQLIQIPRVRSLQAALDVAVSTKIAPFTSKETDTARHRNGAKRVNTCWSLGKTRLGSERIRGRRTGRAVLLTSSQAEITELRRALR